jgi:hypothetical protein
LFDDEIVKVMANLSGRGYGLICFTPIVRSNAAGVSQAVVLARRILTAERRIKMAELARYARVIQFSPQLDLRNELRRWKPRREA